MPNESVVWPRGGGFLTPPLVTMLEAAEAYDGSFLSCWWKLVWLRDLFLIS